MKHSPQPSQTYDILFTTGGSGGHIQSALGVVDIMSEEAKKRTLFVGSNRTMEGEKKAQSMEQMLAVEAGLDFTAIRSGKIQRAFTWHSLSLLGGIIAGFWDSWRLLRRIKPRVVISFGGYVAVPMVFWAKVRKIPVLIHEQTTSVGLANSLAAKFADTIFTSFAESANHFPTDKIILVGQPKRQHMLHPQLRHPAIPLTVQNKLLRFKDNRRRYPIIFFSGGSQGSHLINEQVLKLLPDLAAKYQLVIQTGDNQVFNDYGRLKKAISQLSREQQDRIYLTKFVKEEMGFIESTANLFVGRSGANFCYEVGMWQIPAIFIPIPWVTHNEQHTNAKVLVDLGLATILAEQTLTAEQLHTQIEQELRKSRTVDQQKIDQLFPRDAAQKIWKHLQAYL